MTLNQWLEQKRGEAWLVAMRGTSPDERDDGYDLIDRIKARLRHAR